MSNSTITLQNVANFCSTHADLLPVTGVGGYTNEPFLSIANNVLSELLADPNDWVFNRIEMPTLYTCPNRQDCQFAGASAFTLGSSSQGWGIDLSSNSGISVSGGVVTVKTLETHRFAVGDVVYLTGVTMSVGDATKYNSTFTDNGSSSSWSGGYAITTIAAKSFTFAAVTGQNNSDAGGAPGITDFGYLTSASLTELNNNSSPQNVFPLEAKRELAVSSRVSMPEKVAVMSDLGTGVLKIRFLWIPGSTTYGANLVYQARAPLKVALTDTWAPFPDSAGGLIRQAALAECYRYMNSPLATVEAAKLQGMILKYQAGDDATQTDVNVQPAESLMDGYGFYGWW